MFILILYHFVFQHVSFHVMSQFGNRMLGHNLNFVHVRDTERHSIDLEPVLSASPSRRTDSSKVAKSDTSLCHFPRQFSGLRCLTDFLTETCFRYLSCFVRNVAQWSEILKYWRDELKIQEKKKFWQVPSLATFSAFIHPYKLQSMRWTPMSRSHWIFTLWTWEFWKSSSIISTVTIH